MVDSEIIAGLGTRATWVRGASDLMQRTASADEKALASAIGPGAQLRDVLSKCGLPEAKAIAVLLGMRLRGLVTPMSPPSGGSNQRPGGSSGPLPRQPTGGVSSGPIPRQQTGGARASGAAPAVRVVRQPKPIDAAALNEPVDLEEARKKEVLELESRLDSDDFFTLLGVPVGAPAGDCKKAYYELTKRFHPDRYFGKNLGSFKARIEQVFRRLTEAQATLSDPARRGEYLNQHPELTPAPDDSDPAVDPQLAAQRAVERRARLARHPYLAKAGKLHELVARAKGSLDAGEFGKAIADLTLASQMDPKNHEVTELLSKAKKGSDKRRAADDLKAAQEAEAMNDMVNALARYRSAVSLDPENAELAFRTGRLLAGHGGESELKEAHAHLRKATELAPTKVDYHLAFAKVLVRAGMEKNALREYEAVLKLDAENATAKEQVRKLKWKF